MTDSPFWRFSLAFYAVPGVASACLILQDEGGADVNLLLLLLFLARSGMVVTGDDVGRLDRAIALWREEAVKPMRAMRRRLKDGIGTIPAAQSEALRNLVKKVELEAERIEQVFLEREAAAMTLTQAATPAEAARLNLAAYGAYLGRLPEQALKIVLEAFTDLPP